MNQTTIGGMNIPPKPKRMSERRYRELYDSTPQLVEAPGIRIRCCGAISAEVVASTYRRQGLEHWALIFLAHRVDQITLDDVVQSVHSLAFNVDAYEDAHDAAADQVAQMDELYKLLTPADEKNGLGD
jgi:hypothetical protein